MCYCKVTNIIVVTTPVEHKPLMVRFILLGNSHTAQYLGNIDQ